MDENNIMNKYIRVPAIVLVILFNHLHFKTKKILKKNPFIWALLKIKVNLKQLIVNIYAQNIINVLW